MSRTPPSLEYLVIYNKSLQASEDVSKDDEDAQEEAHILFYTCRPGGVKRDRMLRQVGLAKALISFSEMFTNGQEACEMVHSTKARLVILSPEKEYWILACVNVAFTETKEKDGTIKKEYHEASVHDINLKVSLARGYQEFKLLHGSFDLLLSKNRASLERHLEKFFTVWAWKWDLETPANFVSHLGTPISAYSKRFASLLDEIEPSISDISASVALLSSSHFLASSPSASNNLWNTLAGHLMHLIPPYDPPPVQGTERIGLGKKGRSDSDQNTIRGGKGDDQASIQSDNDSILLGGDSATTVNSNFFNTIPTMKKWGGFLTFNGRKRTGTMVPSAKDVVALPSGSTATATATTTSTEDKDTKGAAEDVTQTKGLVAPKTPQIDQKALDEAMGPLQLPAHGTTSQPQAGTATEVKDKDQSHGNGHSHGHTHSQSQMPFLSDAMGYLSSAAGSVFGSMHLGTLTSTTTTQPEGTTHATGSTDTKDAQDITNPVNATSTATATVTTDDVDKPDTPKIEEQEVAKGTGEAEAEDGETAAEHALKEALSQPFVRDSNVVSQVDNMVTTIENDTKPENGNGGENENGHEVGSEKAVAEGSTDNPTEAVQTYLQVEPVSISTSASTSRSPSPGHSLDRTRRLSNASDASSDTAPVPPLPPPEAFFVPLSVYLEDKETRELHLRRVYHMSHCGIMLALIMKPENSDYNILSPTESTMSGISATPSTSTVSSRRFAAIGGSGGVEVLEGLGYPVYVDLPRGLEYKVVETLKRARTVLDHPGDKGSGDSRHTGEGSKGGRPSAKPRRSTASTNTATSKTRTKTTSISSLGRQSPNDSGSGTTSLPPTRSGIKNFAVSKTTTGSNDNHAQSDENAAILASLGFASTAGWLFEGQAALRRDKDILEQFSRTTSSQSWYISRRLVNNQEQGQEGREEEEREVHMEIGRKESNLVDVDNDLSSIVRRLEALTG